MRIATVRRAMIALAATAVVAASASAQAGGQRFARAFEPSVTLAAGISNFGVRARNVAARNEYSYSPSLTLAAWADRPLSRRTGLLLGVSVSPLSAQSEDAEQFAASHGRTLIGTIDAALAGRLKPAAPVFFALGGGILIASKRAVSRLGTKAQLEPHGDLIIGLDTRRRALWGFRVLYVNRFVVPGSIDGYDRPGLAYDWSLQLGARRTLGRPLPETRIPAGSAR